MIDQRIETADMESAHHQEAIFTSRTSTEIRKQTIVCTRRASIHCCHQCGNNPSEGNDVTDTTAKQLHVDSSTNVSRIKTRLR